MLLRFTSEKKMRVLCCFCCMVYFLSYLTRLNYAACMVELTGALGIGKSVAGLPVTLCFVSYGAGQLVFGILGDKWKPQRMIFAGLMGTAACNLLVAAFWRMEVILPVWCLNGVFQSMLWPPLVRIMAETLDDRWYRRSCVLVSMASAAATVLIYVLTPLCIQAVGLRSVFLFPAALGALGAFVWILKTGRLSEDGSGRAQGAPEQRAKAGGPGIGRLFAAAPLAAFMLAIILHGILKDGISTWMPVYMSDMFGMSSTQSILSAALIPVFSALSIVFSSALLGKLKNEVVTAILLFGAGALASGVMLAAYDSLPAVCIAMMTFITGCMYGVNLMLISRVPGRFAKLGKVSTVSGILNASTYAGSALSTYVFGAVAERVGWLQVVMIWLAVACLGTLVLVLSRRKWSGFLREQM